MYRRLVRALAILVVVFSAILAAVPADTAAEQTCEAAKGHLMVGSLGQAKKLYESVKAADDDKACAVEGLRLVADKQQEAAELVAAGQQAIRSGHLSEAENSFRKALDLNTASAAAAAGIARVTDLTSRPLPTAVSNGNRFYTDWLLPVGRLTVLAAIGLLILYALSGVCSRVLVKVQAAAWTAGVRLTARVLGFVVLFAASVMTPLFAMFNPFRPTWTHCWIAATVLLLVGLAAAGLVFRGARNKAWGHWRVLLLAIGIVTAAGCVLGWADFVRAYDVRLMLVHIALVTLGVLVTAAAFGQNLRLQVEVHQANGELSAASSDYLLARMKDLGTEAPALHKATSARSTPLSQIPVEELSVLPAGKVVGALSRLFFTLRPDLTWRARVTLVDDNRAATALSRNGQHAASAVFSRADLKLPTEQDPDRARAQMLTGAAAFILVHLSAVHEDLQDGLYGASQWRSVALQVIARSRSLLADDEKRDATRVQILAKAVDEDPGNELARFDYMWAKYDQEPNADTDFGAFAREIDAQYERSKLSATSSHDEGWMPLKIQVLYSSASQWLNAYVEGDGTADERASMLASARRSAEALNHLCDPSKTCWERKDLCRQQAAMHPYARNLLDCIDALSDNVKPRKEAGQHPHDGVPASPRLAYDHACLHTFLAQRKDLKKKARHEQLGYALEDLRRALVTDTDKENVRADPCFTILQSEERFHELVGAPSQPAQGWVRRLVDRVFPGPESDNPDQ